MKKLRWSICLIMLFCVSLGFAVSVNAEEKLFETIVNTDGTVTITNYIGEKPDVVIPTVVDGRKVSAIADNAFKNNEVITSITINASPISIGNYAFANCAALQSISCNGAVSRVGNYVCTGCVSLQSVIFNGAVSKVDMNAFSGCVSLQSVVFNGSVNSIEMSAFSGCAILENVVCKGSIGYVGDSAFLNCASLVQVKANAGILKIGNYAFRGCSSLTDMNLSNTTKIGAYAFLGCDQLVNVTVRTKTKSIGKNAFMNCSNELVINLVKKSKMESYAKTNKLTYVFSDKTLIKGTKVTYKDADYVITKSDVKKGTCRFEGTKEEVTKFVIPASISVNGIKYKVTEIKDYAFLNAKKLHKVTIGANVTTIGSGSFAFCTKLSSVSILSKKLKHVENDAFEYLPKKCKITAPASKKATYSKLIKR